MADQRRKAQTQEAEWQTERSVLSEILYLDSPTDYREYLPRVVGLEEEFITLDDVDVAHYDWSLVGIFTLSGLLAALLLLLTVRN
jgi:hypothetical protein